jgi:hypothetical protein
MNPSLTPISERRRAMYAPNSSRRRRRCEHLVLRHKTAIVVSPEPCRVCASPLNAIYYIPRVMVFRSPRHADKQTMIQGICRAQRSEHQRGAKQEVCGSGFSIMPNRLLDTSTQLQYVPLWSNGPVASRANTPHLPESKNIGKSSPEPATVIA